MNLSLKFALDKQTDQGNLIKKEIRSCVFYYLTIFQVFPNFQCRLCRLDIFVFLIYQGQWSFVAASLTSTDNKQINACLRNTHTVNKIEL